VQIPSEIAQEIEPEAMIMKEAVASFVITKKRMQNGRVYESPRIYLPTKLTTDSSFPFLGATNKLFVRVAGTRLVVERAPRDVLKRFGRLTKTKRRVRRRRS
jgi:hypothetical protein